MPAVLLFPSHGPESLSRVLLEASALGVPIAAMDTGGTRDIVIHDETGLLSKTPGALARDLGRLLSMTELRARVGHGLHESASASGSPHPSSSIAGAGLYEELRRRPRGGDSA